MPARSDRRSNLAALAAAKHHSWRLLWHEYLAAEGVIMLKGRGTRLTSRELELIWGNGSL